MFEYHFNAVSFSIITEGWFYRVLRFFSRKSELKLHYILFRIKKLFLVIVFVSRYFALFDKNVHKISLNSSELWKRFWLEILHVYILLFLIRM